MEKGRGETKILKRGQAGSRGGCLKRRGVGIPLRTMWYVIYLFIWLFKEWKKFSTFKYYPF